jgi:hypothetical protein
MRIGACCFLIGLTGVGLATAAADASDSFTLTAGIADLSNYFPTYLANGYWSLASTPKGTDGAASQMAGVMDYSRGDVSRPAAIPLWNDIDYFDGEGWLNEAELNPDSHQHYQQTLNMREGVLRTAYRWQHAGRSTDIAVETFVSQADAHIAVVTLALRPQFTGRIHVRVTLRPVEPPARLPLAEMNAEQFAAAAAAANAADAAQGGKRDAIWYPGEVKITDRGAAAPGASKQDLMMWMTGTAVGGAHLGLAVALAAPAGMHTGAAARGASAGLSLDLEGMVRPGRTYRFTKYVAATADGWAALPVDVRAAATAARARGLASLRAAHAAAWHALWRSDIAISGDADLQRTIHSDLFYLLENTTRDQPWPAAACGFSPHYFGHVFWDNDLWVFPALLLLRPERARGLIGFRSRFLPEAQARARVHGFEGAMYPWEADPGTGLDVTPAFAVENADREIHVNSAVALAQWQYYLASGDVNWLRQEGYSVIAAVADFWASRSTWDEARQRFEILNVTSPEEDYVHVDNEIYTNVAAHQSLIAAQSAARVLGLSPRPRWGEVAGRLYLPTTGEAGRYYDFDPSTPHDKTTSWMATSVPMLSIPAVNFEASADTLEGLLRHSSSAVGRVRDRANQMILVMLAMQAADAGDVAYFDDVIGGGGGRHDPFLRPPFNVRSETPQNDSTYLLASSGGFIQAFAYGLSGLRLAEAGLVERYPPRLPSRIASLTLQHIVVRGQWADVRLARAPSGRIQRTVSWQPTSRART